jgi:hypothetical protein
VGVYSVVDVILRYVQDILRISLQFEASIAPSLGSPVSGSWQSLALSILQFLTPTGHPCKYQLLF